MTPSTDHNVTPPAARINDARAAAGVLSAASRAAADASFAALANDARADLSVDTARRMLRVARRLMERASWR